MADNKSFADLAEEMISQATIQYVELTQAQQEAVAQYKAAKAAIDTKKTAIDTTESQVINEIKAKFNDKRSALAAHAQKLKDAYVEECVALGLRKEDIPFGETQIVKSIDNGAKTIVRSGAGIVRSAKSWLDEAINS